MFEEIEIADKCVFVSDGKQAVEHCIRSAKQDSSGKLVQVLILDYEMPHMSGLQVISEIKAFVNIQHHSGNRLDSQGREQHVRAKTRMPTFCMFSNHTKNKAFQEYASQHVDHFLSKPPNSEEIFKIVVSKLREES